jgi:hypothetical protein
MKCSKTAKIAGACTGSEGEIEYYHIVLDNYFTHTIIAENVEVESCFKFNDEDDSIASWSCTKECCQPLIVTRVYSGSTIKFKAERVDLPQLSGDTGTDTNKFNFNLKDVNKIGLIKIEDTSFDPIDDDDDDDDFVYVKKKFNLSTVNTRNISKIFYAPFDPRNDTYQMVSGRGSTISEIKINDRTERNVSTERNVTTQRNVSTERNVTTKSIEDFMNKTQRLSFNN